MTLLQRRRLITGAWHKRADGGPRTGCISFPRPSRRLARLTNSNTTSAADAPIHFLVYFQFFFGRGGHSSQLNAQSTRRERLSIPSDNSDAVSSVCLPPSCYLLEPSVLLPRHFNTPLSAVCNNHPPVILQHFSLKPCTDFLLVLSHLSSCLVYT